MNRSSWPWLSCVLAFLILAMVSCSPSADDDYSPDDSGAPSAAMAPEATTTALPTSAAPHLTFTVQRGEVIRRLVIGGRVAPLRETAVFFKTGGRVKSVLVKSGDTVKAGQLLAELEMTNVDRDMAGAKLELAAAEARLTSATDARAHGARQAELNLEIARENLAITRTQDPAPRKARAEAELQAAASVRQEAKKRYDALPAGPERDASPEATRLRAANVGYATAKAALDVVLQEVAAFGHRVTIAERQVELAQLEADRTQGPPDPQMQSDIDRAQFAVTRLQEALDQGRMKAPFDGVVRIDFGLSPGAQVDAYRYLGAVSDLSALEIAGQVVNVPLDQVSAGMPATVSMVAQPGLDYPAHIRLTPASGMISDSTAEKTLRVSLDDPQPRLENGSVVRITLVLERKSDVLWLPPQAIRVFEGRRFVLVQDVEAERRVDVGVGVQADDRVEIVSGLVDGQTIIAP